MDEIIEVNSESIHQFEENLRVFEFCLKCGNPKQLKLVFCWRCWSIFKYYNGSALDFISDLRFDFLTRKMIALLPFVNYND